MGGVYGVRTARIQAASKPWRVTQSRVSFNPFV